MPKLPDDPPGYRDETPEPEIPKASNATELATKVAAVAAGDKPVRRDPAAPYKELMERMSGQYAKALGRYMDTERFIRIATTNLNMSPDLLKCEPISFIAATMQIAELRLYPGMLGQAYIVPFYSTKRKAFLAQLIVGYKGYVDLLYRSGHIKRVDAHTVYAGDEFTYQYGRDAFVKHRPELDPAKRGEAIAYYAEVETNRGGYLFHVMSREDVIEHMERYVQKRNRESGPWADQFDKMAQKTCLRQLVPYLPVSAEVKTALLAADESVKTEVAEDTINTVAPDEEASAAIEAEFVEVTEASEIGETP